MPNHAVYVSYNWKAEEESKVVDKLQTACTSRGIELIRDKTHVDYCDSISAFMNDLGRARHVILVLSDNYFQSDLCMQELRQVYDNKDFRRRAHPIVLKDTRLHRPIDRVRFLRHWENEEASLVEELKTIGRVRTASFNQIVDRYHDHRLMMEKLTDVLSDMKG